MGPTGGWGAIGNITGEWGSVKGREKKSEKENIHFIRITITYVGFGSFVVLIR